MTNMKDKVPPESLVISPPVPYSDRRKMCSCDCYQAELLGHALPFLEILLEASSNEKEASKYMELKTLIETIKPFQNIKYEDGCGSPW